MSKRKRSASTVYKSNFLINARYSLKLCEHRVILLCLTQIKNPRDPYTPRAFRIYGEDYALQFKTSKTNAYRDIKEALEGLWQREVYMDHVEEKDSNGKIINERWRKIRWITSQSYASGQGKAEITFHEEIMPFLTALKGHFSYYDCMHVSLFQSTYSHRIYEFLIQYRDFGRRELDVSELMCLLKLEGKYKNWSDFRRFVLDAAMREINSHSDIEASYEPIKKGKAVRSLRFVFHSKRGELALVEPLERVQNNVSLPWQLQGYRSPGEFREALELSKTHDVAFSSAQDFINFRARLHGG